jgi:nickel-dependent lactate racemase
LGEIPAAFVREASEELMDTAIPVQVSNYLLDPSYDLIISIGQVVPHEVVGMANYTKNIVVGCGGSGFISASHMVGAFYGIERILGEADTPVRRLFDYAEEHFISKLPLEYVLTVTDLGKIIGLYIGPAQGCGRGLFEKAAALSAKRNITYVEHPIKNCVVYLDESEFHSTWIGNKAIYRTRMAIADGGHLLVLAPGVRTFGEDAENDRLIRKYGYTGRERILELCKTEAELQNNLSAAAHLIHGSADGRFKVTYAAPLLGREAIEAAGYGYMDWDEAIGQYNPKAMQPGINNDIYFIPNPALGLWKAY